MNSKFNDVKFCVYKDSIIEFVSCGVDGVSKISGKFYDEGGSNEVYLFNCDVGFDGIYDVIENINVCNVYGEKVNGKESIIEGWIKNIWELCSDDLMDWEVI